MSILYYYRKIGDIILIYIVEDDRNIRELMVYTLESTGFLARGFEDGTNFLTAVSQEAPELILLDVMLPGADGISILKKLKANTRTKDIPVIMVTAKGTEYEKVMGLDAGADDYVAKPFGMMELVSRVKAVIRRSARNTVEVMTEVITFGDISIDMAEHQVRVTGKKTPLTLKEFDLLERLVKNPGRVLTREFLLSEIWGYDFDGETRTIDVHIRSLRQKLGTAGDLISTVRGVGYKLGGRDE